MWINKQEQKPKFDGAYIVFGTVNKGTEHETNCRYTAYWSNVLEAFTDKDDDLIYNDERIKFWFDFNAVPDPV